MYIQYESHLDIHNNSITSTFAFHILILFEENIYCATTRYNNKSYETKHVV